ncbi:hypothetical protein RKD18_006508 [Streptomyces phaeoluteigriseus]
MPLLANSSHNGRGPAADLGLQGVAVRVEHPQGRQDPRGPAADPAREPVPLAHQFRIDTQAARVEEDALPLPAAEPSHVHPHRLTAVHRPAQRPDVRHPEVVGEVVQGPAGHDGQRQPVPQGDLGGRVRGAVAAAHPEHPGARRGLLQLPRHVARFARDDLRARQRVAHRPHPVGGPRRRVDHDDQALPVRQRGRLGARRGGRRRDRRRHQGPYGERGAGAEDRAREDVAREMNARVDAGHGHRERDRRHRGPPRR